MGGQNFTEEHFILCCVDVHAQGQGMHKDKAWQQ